MTKDELIEQFKKMLLQHPPILAIEELFNRAIESGALEYGWEDTDSFGTAKVIYYAILQTLADEWMPVSETKLNEAENLMACM